MADGELSALPSAWRFDYRRSQALPPLAWLAGFSGTTITVDCGLSIRATDAGFVEGSWAGAPDVTALAGATTVFGSGIVLDRGAPLVVTPSHNLESLYACRAQDALFISNSLVALLVAADLELDPDVDYPARFGRIRDGIAATPITLPVRGATIEMWSVENLRLGPPAAGAGPPLARSPKPREAPFTSFADYRDRLCGALASVVDNAPGYEPVVPLSSGYDSSAVAVLAASLGARRAIGFGSAKAFAAGGDEAPDSGAASAQRLGLEMATAERLGYRARDDLPEAEFLASGMSGEEVVFSAFEPQLRRTLMLAGTWPAWIWAKSAPAESNLERDDVSGASMTEFRLRVDCVYVPVPYFGATAQPSIVAIARQAEMAPFVVGGRYDRPIPRRLAEEAGLPRGSFAISKLGVSATLHSRPREAFAPATLAAIDAFAAARGQALAITERRKTGRLHRGLQRLAQTLGAHRLAAALQRRRQARTHFAPRIGNLVLRWAVETVAPRYAALRDQPGSDDRTAVASGE